MGQRREGPAHGVLDVPAGPSGHADQLGYCKPGSRIPKTDSYGISHSRAGSNCRPQRAHTVVAADPADAERGILPDQIVRLGASTRQKAGEKTEIVVVSGPGQCQGYR
jgi:hypothetical protein